MIYLINPSEKQFLDNAGDRIPLGLLSIAANIKGDVKVFDLNHYPELSMMQQFYLDKPDAVGMSVYTSPAINESLRIAEKMKGKTRLIAGGHHASALPHTLTDCFDSVVVGEGEVSFNYAMKQDGIIGPITPNLDRLNNPSRYLIDVQDYGVDQSGKRTATLITSRGCPMACSFCGKLEDKVRFEPVDKVKAQIDQVQREGFKSIYFLDDVFTMKRDRMKEIAEYTSNEGLPFRVTTRANMLDEDRIKTLADNGCEWLSMGIESGNDEILARSNKGMKSIQNYYAVDFAHKHGIKTKGFFILGLPGESEKTARDTIDFAKKLKSIGLTTADFYYLTPFPGTPIWNNPEQFGITIKDKDFTTYLQAGDKARCVIDTEHLKSERIEELVKEAKGIFDGK